MTESVAPTISTAKTLDDVLRRCGDFGRFQWFHYFFLSMMQISACLVSLYYVYGAAEPEHRCRLPSSVWPNDNQFNPTDIEYEARLRQYIPLENDRWDQCHLWNSTSSNTTLVDCSNGWIFDRSVFGFTFTEEASLVCHDKAKKSWLATLVQTAGFLLLITGTLADRFGRKTTIIGVSLLLSIVCLSMQIVMQWIPMSMNLKFSLLLINQFGMGLVFSTATIAFVLMLELTTSTYRSLAGNIGLASFAFGGVLITLFAYLTHHWQKLLWTLTVFIGLSYPYLYYMPESPMYLYSTKQYTKLEKLLRRIAKANGRTDSEWHPTFQEFLNTQPSLHAVNEEKQTFAVKIRQLVCHRATMKRLLISNLIAFTGMLLFIKISYGLATMKISPYLGIVIGAAVEIIGYIIANILMSTRLGRKRSLMIFTGLTCVCVVMIPWLTKYSTVATAIISQLGKFAVSASLAVTWIFISELFPTSIRGSANGVVTAISRLGAITAPIIDSSIGEQYLPITFYVYGCLALLTLLSIILLPETRNVVLGDTTDVLNHRDGTGIMLASPVNSDDIEI